MVGGVVESVTVVAVAGVLSGVVAHGMVAGGGVVLKHWSRCQSTLVLPSGEAEQKGDHSLTAITELKKVLAVLAK